MLQQQFSFQNQHRCSSNFYMFHATIFVPFNLHMDSTWTGHPVSLFSDEGIFFQYSILDTVCRHATGGWPCCRIFQKIRRHSKVPGKEGCLVRETCAYKQMWRKEVWLQFIFGVCFGIWYTRFSQACFAFKRYHQLRCTRRNCLYWHPVKQVICGQIEQRTDNVWIVER